MVRAAGAGQLDAMKLLAEGGVPLSPTAPGETTPLHTAVIANDAKTVSWLIAQRVPDSPDASGMTALQRADALGRRKLSKLLRALHSSPELPRRNHQNQGADTQTLRCARA